VGDDAVRHGVWGDVGLIVPDVSDVGGSLRLIVAEDYGCSRRCRGDASDELGVGVDDTLRIAVGLCTAITHDPGFSG
jgi:hypothetical protein